MCHKLKNSKEKTARQALTEELAMLKLRQIVAQNAAALRGMTTEESTEYKVRHNRIKQLLKKLETHVVDV